SFQWLSRRANSPPEESSPATASWPRQCFPVLSKGVITSPVSIGSARRTPMASSSWTSSSQQRTVLLSPARRPWARSRSSSRPGRSEPMLIVLCSGGHSPGVTTTGLALTLTWPRDILLAECDPAGGSLLSGYLLGHSRER